LPSFGEKLKLEREKRKITLEQISASTKIGTRMLQALEEDKFSQLPGGIFNKGFVRAYARTVGLDEDQTVADYLQASGDAPLVNPETMGREGGREGDSRDGVRETEARINRLEAISDNPSRPLPWGVFAVVLLAIALGLSLWSHRRREQEKLAEQPVPTSVTARPSATTAPAENASSATSATVAASQPSPTGTQTNTATSPITPVPSGEKTPSGSSQDSASTQSSLANGAVPAMPSAGKFVVALHTHEESWISITVDGKPTGSELLPAGAERTVQGRREIVVKAGNVGGVDFQFNGKRVNPGGGYGEVKTVSFGPGGMLANVQEPPSAP